MINNRLLIELLHCTLWFEILLLCKNRSFKLHWYHHKWFCNFTSKQVAKFINKNISSAAYKSTVDITFVFFYCYILESLHGPAVYYTLKALNITRDCHNCTIVTISFPINTINIAINNCRQRSRARGASWLLHPERRLFTITQKYRHHQKQQQYQCNISFPIRKLQNIFSHISQLSSYHKQNVQAEIDVWIAVLSNLRQLRQALLKSTLVLTEMAVLQIGCGTEG